MRVQERVIKVSQAGLSLRVWCAAADLRDDAEFEEQRASIVRAVTPEVTAADHPAVDAAEAVAKLPFCNGVEVSDGPLRQAVIIYPEWP